jgi:ElaB/YqjD/DUF883 family membrane-anchored ribosome-binding protein
VVDRNLAGVLPIAHGFIAVNAMRPFDLPWRDYSDCDNRTERSSQNNSRQRTRLNGLFGGQDAPCCALSNDRSPLDRQAIKLAAQLSQRHIWKLALVNLAAKLGLKVQFATRQIFHRLNPLIASLTHSKRDRISKVPLDEHQRRGAEPFSVRTVDRSLEVKSGVHSMLDQNTRTNATATNPSSSDGKAMSDNYDALRADLSKLSQSVKTYAGENLGNAASDAQHAVQEQLGGLEAIVRKNPVQSALIAAGIGLVVGLIMTR